MTSDPAAPEVRLTLSVVVPTYREAANVPVLFERLKTTLDGLPWEMIVVDDNSPDGTADIAFASLFFVWWSTARALFRQLRRAATGDVARGGRDEIALAVIPARGLTRAFPCRIGVEAAARSGRALERARDDIRSGDARSSAHPLRRRPDLSRSGQCAGAVRAAEDGARRPAVGDDRRRRQFARRHRRRRLRHRAPRPAPALHPPRQPARPGGGGDRGLAGLERRLSSR